MFYNIIDKKLLRRRVHPILFVVLSFFIVIIIGAILLTLPISSSAGKWTNFVDALFTSTSATCVTGLVVKDTGTYFSLFGQIVILLMIQIGGLGYMTITTFFALLIGRKIQLNERVILQNNLNRPTLKQIIVFAKHVFFAVIIIEGIGSLILFFRWKYLGFWKALKFGVFHAVSAFNNAGFDVVGNFKSLTEYVHDPIVNLTITFLIISGGIGFLVISNLYGFFVHKKKVSLQSKIVLLTTLFLIISGTFLILTFESRNPETLGKLSLGGKIYGAYFQSVSARTAGFNTIDIGKMTMAGLFTLIILMFIGASPGGTGGGIKTVTFTLLVFAIIALIREKQDTEIMNRSIPDRTIFKAMSIFIVSLMLVSLITLLLCAFNPFSFIQNLFETVSAFGTVGLSTGITPYLNTISKLLVSFTTFVGRVGVLSLILILAQRRSSGKVKLPEEEISVG